LVFLIHTQCYRIWDGVHNPVAYRTCQERYLILGISVTSSGMI